MSVLPDLRQYNSILRSSWCGLVGCPYPYVTKRIIAPAADIPGPQVAWIRVPEVGAGLQDGNVGQVEMEEEWDDGDYSPISAE